MAGPLEGIRVVDLSQVISGPWATMLLADQGAEVVKVELSVGGEVLRPLPNFGRGGINSLIANNNRGKLGLAIDLGSERGSIPRHGGDTDEVLRSAGLTDDEIACLRADGVVGPRPA